jgi:hypothetical protein
VVDLGGLVEFSTDTVAYELTDYRAALGFRKLLDGGSHITKPSAIANFRDAKSQTPSRHFGDVFAFRRRLTDIKRSGGVSVKPIEKRGDIDVEDVPGLEFLRAGNPMAHHFIDGRANAFGKAVVVEG